MHKELICPEHQKLALVAYEEPKKPDTGSVRIRNEFGAEKHGTMMSFYKGHGNKRGAWDREKKMHISDGFAWPYPIKLGNMNVGVVEEAGQGCTRYRKGDRVFYFGNFRPMSTVSEALCWSLPKQANWKAAVCLDPLSYALCALRDGNIRVGDAVAVFGLGAIGLMAVQAAKLTGAYPIIAIDPLANRRAVAEATGADDTIDPVGTDVGAMLREKTDWRGVDVVIEYSGAMEAMQASLRGVAFGGTIVAGAFPGPMKAGLDLGAEAHMNRPNLVFSRTESEPNRDYPRWNNERIRNTCHHLIVEGLINAEQVVSPVVAYDENIVSEYLKIASEPQSNVKLGVKY